MTHYDACKRLEHAALLYKAGELSVTAWYQEVDRVITAVEQRATSTQPAPTGAPAEPVTPSRTSSAPGSRLLAAGRNQAPAVGRVTERA